MNPASGALANLSEKPNSLLGKSAAAGRETGRKIEQAQQQAVGAAGVLSGDRVAAEIGPLLFHPPAEWEALKPTAQFQTALYRVAADEGEGEARVVFFHFTQGGGDVASNIARWRGMVIGPDGQPAEALVRDRTLAGYKTKLVSMEGTYKDGMPGGPTTDRPNYGFRGAIIETDQGNVFVRFFGPKALVDANAKTWEEMVIGAARK
jgi:hypothetical protein